MVLFSIYKRITSLLYGHNFGAIPGVRPLHRLLFRWLRPRRTVEVKIRGGRKLLIDPNDTGTAPYLLLHGVYDAYMTDLFRQIVKPGMTVLDVGANIGYYTVLFADAVGESGVVRAFEPEPTTYKLLVQNVRRNGLTNVRANCSALSDAEGMRELFLDTSNLGNFSFSKENIPPENVGKSLSVDLTTVDAYCDDMPVHFIKIDVQGAEGKVVDGGMRVIERHRPILVLEFWPYGLRNCGSNPLEMLKRLDRLGYRFSIIDSKRRTTRRHSPEELLGVSTKRDGGKGWADILCEP